MKESSKSLIKQYISDYLHDNWPYVSIVANWLATAWVVLFKNASLIVWVFWMVYAVLLLLQLVSSVVGKKFEKNIKEIRGDLDTIKNELSKCQGELEVLLYESQNICHGIVYDIANGSLGFGKTCSNYDKTSLNNERISLYLYNAFGFVLIARYSKNMEYNKTGRDLYPTNDGCLGEAWKQGFFFIQLPVAHLSLEKWIEENKKYGIKKVTAKNMKMKSSLYCSVALKNNMSSDPIGVLVLESTDPNRYTEENLREIFTDDRLSPIARLLEILKPRLGTLRKVTQEGL